MLLVLAMVLLTLDMGAGVISRYGGGGALPWTDEVAGYLFAAVTFMGAAACASRDEHVRIEVLTRRLGRSAQGACRAIGLGAMLFLLAVLISFGVESVQQAADSPMVSLPISQGWGYVLVPVSAALITLFAIRNFFMARPRPYEVLLVAATVTGFRWLGALQIDGLATYGYLTGVLLLTLMIGVPVAFALALAATAVLNSTDIPLDIVPQRLFDGTSNVILTAIPMFMLTGALMTSGGMATRLVGFVTTVFGRMRGGLGIANIGASVIFADISGSAVADSAAIGTIMIPQMIKRGYPAEFAAALQSAAGSLGLMFPPSSTMIIYAWVAGVSVRSLFLHSFVPGLMVAASYAGLTYFYAVRRGYPREPRTRFRDMLAAGGSAVFALMSPVVILGAILGGFTTPSEAGVVAVVYTMLVAVAIYRTLKWHDLYGVILEASLGTARITLIIAAATLVSWVIASFQGPQRIGAAILDISQNRIVVLILLNILMTVLHVVLEGASTILILVPVILPILQQLHIDPTVFGVILVQNSALGLLFPPLGFILYVIAGISGVRVERIAISVLPFIGILALDILALIMFPQISGFLPSLLQ